MTCSTVNALIRTAIPRPGPSDWVLVTSGHWRSPRGEVLREGTIYWRAYDGQGTTLGRAPSMRGAMLMCDTLEAPHG